MRRFKTSIVARGALIWGVLFIVLWMMVPDLAFKYLGWALILGAGFAAILRWLPDAYRAVRYGRDGASFLIVGAFCLICGVVLHRIVIVGDATWPDSDLFNSDFMFLVVIWYIAFALGLLCVSPDVTDGVVPSRSLRALAISIAFGSFVMGYAFAVGMTAVPATIITPDNSDNPGCPQNRPIWGSENGVYHTPDSVYRDQMQPDRCFKSVREAEGKGFRAPK